MSHDTQKRPQMTAMLTLIFAYLNMYQYISFLMALQIKKMHAQTFINILLHRPFLKSEK